jgi:hypothetical protein
MRTSDMMAATTWVGRRRGLRRGLAEEVFLLGLLVLGEQVLDVGPQSRILRTFVAEEGHALRGRQVQGAVEEVADAAVAVSRVHGRDPSGLS